MKKIWQYLVRHVKEDFDVRQYVPVFFLFSSRALHQLQIQL
jgi:hypothetical protein